MIAILAMNEIRILLVDDSSEFIHSLVQFLGDIPEITIVGTALDGQGAIEKVCALHPQLVLMDIVMPGMDGLEATRTIKKQYRDIAVVVLTLHNSAEYRQAASEARADAFIPKSELGERLVSVLHSLFPSCTFATA